MKRGLLAVGMLLAACSSPTEGYRHKADAIANGAGMRPVQVPAGKFTLMGYERLNDANAPVRVYIEGDGVARLTVSLVSPDPTPREPIALEMAAEDPFPNVVYLARLCQYVMTQACAPRIWTSAQYSEEAMAAYDSALDRWRGRKLELVGYSGGAAVALLEAARRNDILSIRTVAGNVDTEAFTALHHVSPLRYSLNPASFMDKTARIQQLHFAGSGDKAVPPVLAQGYQSRLPAGNCSAVEVVPGQDHYEGWIALWPTLLTRRLPCS